MDYSGNLRLLLSVKRYAVDSVLHHCQRRSKVRIEEESPSIKGQDRFDSLWE